MRLTTKGRYGLKTMVDLAMEYGRGHVSVAALAKLQGVSDSYLEQLVGALRRADLVISARGAQGGYRLARSPEEITVAQVLQALEESTSLVDCVSLEPSCDNVCSCSTRPLWLKIQSGINAVLRSTTIQDLAEDYTIQQTRQTGNETGLS